MTVQSDYSKKQFDAYGLSGANQTKTNVKTDLIVPDKTVTDLNPPSNTLGGGDRLTSTVTGTPEIRQDFDLESRKASKSLEPMERAKEYEITENPSVRANFDGIWKAWREAIANQK